MASRQRPATSCTVLEVGVVQEALGEEEQRLAPAQAGQGEDGAVHGGEGVARAVDATQVHLLRPRLHHAAAHVRGVTAGQDLGVEDGVRDADPALVVALHHAVGQARPGHGGRGLRLAWAGAAAESVPALLRLSLRSARCETPPTR